MARRSLPFRKNCARYSSLMRDSAAGAGPTMRARRGRLPDPRDQVGRVGHRLLEPPVLDDDVDEADTVGG